MTLLRSLLIYCLLILSVLHVRAEQRLPNIVLIFADDLGYGSVSSYGGPVPTPHIDRLAAQGMRFTQAYSDGAVCTPSRYALLTGEYMWRGALKSGVVEPTTPLIIDTATTTLPGVLKSRGYATAAIGKWHLGYQQGEVDWNAPLKPGPLEIGFDTFFGFATNASSSPRVLIRDHAIVGYDPEDPMKGHTGGAARAHALFSDEALTDQFLHESKQFILDHRDQPFFLYYALHQIHHPIRPNFRFRGKSDKGLYGDFIQDLDWTVGQFTAFLEEQGLADNTLLIFTSDNGAFPGGQDTLPFNRLGQGYVRNGGYGAIDTVARASEFGWSPNGPFRGFKGSLFEGGTRVPFIVRWPGKTPPGARSDALITVADIFPSMARLTGHALKPGDAPDAFNALDLLQNPEAVSNRTELIVSDNKGLLALRSGDWKYVSSLRAEDMKRTGKEFLFNLADDPAEKTDLSGREPARFQEMKDRLDALIKAGTMHMQTTRN